ncbi:hypothetical protein FCOIX_6247 [Fusarium coicis]|nr:hypothetical protein FCOIX_6247 [Fusarium coicis]
MESKGHHLLKTDATRPQTPENRVANNQLDQVTPVGRTVPSHGECILTLQPRTLTHIGRTPDTVARFLDEANIFWSPAVPSSSRNYFTSTDVRMRLPRYQPPMPPVVMSPGREAPDGASTGPPAKRDRTSQGKAPVGWPARLPKTVKVVLGLSVLV